jgi:hypothetical protein
VRSLAVSSGLAILAGLDNGDTRMIYPARAGGQTRTLTGTGSPVTALAVLPGGAVMTGTASGDLRCWPRDPEHGPATFPRRTGGITAMAVAEPWLLIGGEDGRIAVWSTDPVRPLHEIDLGAPVRAISAEIGLAAARDSTGRLWWFDLARPPGSSPPSQQLYARYGDQDLSAPLNSIEVQLLDHSDTPYEITAVTAHIDGEPVGVSTIDHWPALRADGRFLVPARPLPDQPIRLRCTRPFPPESRPTAMPLMPVQLIVEVQSPLVYGYRATQRLSVGAIGGTVA